MEDGTEVLGRIILGLLSYLVVIFGLIIGLFWWRKHREQAIVCFVGMALKLIADTLAVVIAIIAVHNGDHITMHSMPFFLVYLIGIVLDVTVAAYIDDWERSRNG